MINTFLKLLVLVTLMSACTSNTATSSYTPKGLTALTQDKVLEMAKTKTFPIPANIVYKDPKGMVLTLDSLGKIAEPNDYYQTYYTDARGTITEVVIKKASAKEKAFNEKVLAAFNQ